MRRMAALRDCFRLNVFAGPGKDCVGLLKDSAVAKSQTDGLNPTHAAALLSRGRATLTFHTGISLAQEGHGGKVKLDARLPAWPCGRGSGPALGRCCAWGAAAVGALTGGHGSYSHRPAHGTTDHTPPIGVCGLCGPTTCATSDHIVVIVVLVAGLHPLIGASRLGHS